MEREVGLIHSDHRRSTPCWSPSMNRVAADDQDDRHPLTLFFRSLLPRHRNAKGVLRVDQVIHALRGVGNCELNALDLVVEGVTPGAGATISNSLLWNFFRRCE